MPKTAGPAEARHHVTPVPISDSEPGPAVGAGPNKSGGEQSTPPKGGPAGSPENPLNSGAPGGGNTSGALP